MKILDIAWKDLVRSFRSSFLLVMMFIVPLLITGIIYLAFGGLASGQNQMSMPPARVLVANLDQPDPQIELEAGQLLVEYLQGPELKRIMQVNLARDEASARTAVDHKEADVAVIIPGNFSRAVETPQMRASITLYQDPTLTVGPGVVRTVVGEFVDGLEGGKIAVQVTEHQMSQRGLTLDGNSAEQVAMQYTEWLQGPGHSHGESAGAELLAIRAPTKQNTASDMLTVFLGPVMAGMMILFVFFTGAASAQSIIYEDEGGTLARLFTTPTPRSAILGGKYVSVLMTLVVQVIVLMLAASILFRIRWGEPLVVALAIAGLVVAASGFGVFLMSFVKTTRQAGVVLGAVITITGILGGLVPTGDPSQPSVFDTIGLAMPQGWALRAFKMSMAGANGEVLLPVAVLLLLGMAFFAVGAWMFRRRFD